MPQPRERTQAPLAEPFDFVVVGASKSATTRLYRYLRRHPRLFLPEDKDTPWCSTDVWRERGWNWVLEECFAAAPEGSIRATVTPRNMEDPRVPTQIAAEMPDLKLVALLRDPIDRAASHYRQQVRRAKKTRGAGGCGPGAGQRHVGRNAGRGGPCPRRVERLCGFTPLQAAGYERLLGNAAAVAAHPEVGADLHYKTGWLHYHPGTRNSGRRHTLRSVAQRPLRAKIWLSLRLHETLAQRGVGLNRTLSSLRRGHRPLAAFDTRRKPSGTSPATFRRPGRE